MAREASASAQRSQERQANKKRRVVDFDVGDKVYVDKSGWTTDRPTTRLDSQHAGPFTIVRKQGSSFEVDLPEGIKASRVLHAKRLRKAADDPLPQQHVEPPPPENINGEPEYEVQEVLGSRISRGKLQYQVCWRGCDPDDTYYPAENFKNAPTRLLQFHEKFPQAAGPPIRLTQWLRAAANDTVDEPHTDDNTALHKGEATVKRRH